MNYFSICDETGNAETTGSYISCLLLSFNSVFVSLYLYFMYSTTTLHNTLIFVNYFDIKLIAFSVLYLFLRQLGNEVNERKKLKRQQLSSRSLWKVNYWNGQLIQCSYYKRWFNKRQTKFKQGSYNILLVNANIWISYPARRMNYPVFNYFK